MEPATRPVYKPWFTHLLLHNKPSPNSVAFNNSSLSCLTVLELTELCQAFPLSDFLIPHASLLRVRWSMGPESSKVLMALATSSLICLVPQVVGNLTREHSNTSFYPQLLHMARLDFLTRCGWSQGSLTSYVAARSLLSTHSKRPRQSFQSFLMYFQSQKVTLYLILLASPDSKYRDYPRAQF